MPSERGDSKPCTHAECSGNMQFGRKPLPPAPLPSMKAGGERGWVCSDNPSHFQIASGQLPIEAAASSIPGSRWDDDGGSMQAKPSSAA